jgi:NarL family two-component system sensor histidine kinase LiaS
MAADERPSAGGSTRRSMADVSRFVPKSKLQHEAMQDARHSLARDLHDGLLQTLTAIMLQVDAVSKEIVTDAKAARAHLQAIGNLIAAEQRDLRAFAQRLKPTAGTPATSPAELATALETVRKRTQQLGGVRVEIVVAGDGSIPRHVGDEVYRIVQEALANVARHARAQSARVVLTIRFDEIRITVSDNGCGFPFRGEFDLAALTARNCGPASLRERVAGLGGTLMLRSRLSGSSLEIVLPFEPHEPTSTRTRPDPRGRSASAGDN